jgi:hypothetical protein
LPGVPEKFKGEKMDLVWPITVVLLALIIALTCVFDTIYNAHMDKIQPERLKRFELEPYKKGVEDSTPSIPNK